MLLSVIIPTYRRPEKLAAAIAALAEQSTQEFELLVTFDGQDESSQSPRCARDLAKAAWRGRDPGRLRFFEGARLGVCAARNRAIDAARGELFVFFNDDVVPRRDCLRAHLEAHEGSSGYGHIVVGDSPWKPREKDSLFARMLRETSMVFFHHRMRGATDSNKDWGFRHAWLLNLSARACAVRAVGGLRVIQQTYGRDDDELAFRMTRELQMKVLWRPQAVVDHDHPMTPEEYLRREHELGAGAATFARGAPSCALAMFGRDLLSMQSREHAAAFVRDHECIASELTPWFLSLEHQEPDALDVQEAYQKHLPLKRWWWNRAFLASIADAASLSDVQRTLPGSVLIAPSPALHTSCPPRAASASG